MTPWGWSRKAKEHSAAGRHGEAAECYSNASGICLKLAIILAAISVTLKIIPIVLNS